MSIRTRTVVFVVVSLLLMGGGLYFFLGRVLMGGFRTVEREDARRNLQRVQEAVTARLTGLEHLTLDWALWDETYNFLLGKNPVYLEENDTESFYESTETSFMAFVALDGTLAHANGRDFRAGQPLPVPDWLKTRLTPGDPLLAADKPTSAVTGLVAHDGQVLLVCAAAVSDSAGEAAPVGHVVFAQILDEAMGATLAETTHLKVAFRPPRADTEDLTVSERDEDTLVGEVKLRDVGGQPVLAAVVDLPRSIYAEGRHSLKYMTFFIVGLGLGFGLLVLVLLETGVVRRVVRLNRDVTKITEAMDFSRLVDVKGKDEISSLAGSINGMLSAVSEFMSAYGEDAGTKKPEA